MTALNRLSALRAGNDVRIWTDTEDDGKSYVIINGKAYGSWPTLDQAEDFAGCFLRGDSMENAAEWTRQGCGDRDLWREYVALKGVAA